MDNKFTNMLWNVFICILIIIAASDGYTKWIIQRESDFVAKEGTSKAEVRLQGRKSAASKIFNLHTYDILQNLGFPK